MQTIPRRVKIFVLAGILVAGSLVISLVLSFDGGVPKEFSEARLQGAMIAQNIVELSSKSTLDLESIGRLEKAGDYKGALEVVAGAVKRSQEIRENALKLSNELERMTKSLSDLGSFEAQQSALEAISNHLALVSRLINYSAYMGDLLSIIQSKLSGDWSRSGQVQELLNQVNAEVTAINSFNNQANQAMERFDAIINRK